MLETGNRGEFTISEVFKNSGPVETRCKKGEKLSRGEKIPPLQALPEDREPLRRGALPPAALPPPPPRRARRGEGAPRRAAPAGPGGEGSVRLSLKCKILVAAVWGEESASPLTCAAAL